MVRVVALSSTLELRRRVIFLRVIMGGRAAEGC
jgi:hypothetical protein